MKSWIIGTLFLLLIMVGCSDEKFGTQFEDGFGAQLPGDRPPEVKIEVNNRTYETVLGTYCWSSENLGLCVDTAGPKELTKGKALIQAEPGEEINVVMNYQPQPSKIHLSEESEAGEMIEVEVADNHFFAPEEPRIYYYYYGVWWMDQKEKNVSLGDAFYAFALEVTADEAVQSAVEWVNVIKWNDRKYYFDEKKTEELTEGDVDEEIGTVTFTVRGSKEETNPSYQLKNGEATFVSTGATIYSITVENEEDYIFAQNKVYKSQ